MFCENIRINKNSYCVLTKLCKYLKTISNILLKILKFIKNNLKVLENF